MLAQVLWKMMRMLLPIEHFSKFFFFQKCYLSSIKTIKHDLFGVVSWYFNIKTASYDRTLNTQCFISELNIANIVNTHAPKKKSQ